jgi:hypothetical protein
MTQLFLGLTQLRALRGVWILREARDGFVGRLVNGEKFEHLRDL